MTFFCSYDVNSALEVVTEMDQQLIHIIQQHHMLFAVLSLLFCHYIPNTHRTSSPNAGPDVLKSLEETGSGEGGYECEQFLFHVAPTPTALHHSMLVQKSSRL
ncbi:uncharacterized protein LOC111867173 [Cryptotermes secundus]|uniref:uncharacterized protein LOC111867173 n=1 Tax=Cryptotermes secundus TaxID=105785 RepID=UPI000CD7DC8F|nr:uncharacterized protein LOC111867173 [Cryptotermes secundus]